MHKSPRLRYKTYIDSRYINNIYPVPTLKRSDFTVKLGSLYFITMSEY